MQKLIAVTLLLASGAWPTAAFAGGKKGKLNSTIEITRTDRVEIPPLTQTTEVDGLTATVTLDHEATVIVQGIVTIYASRPITVSVVADNQTESQPLVYATGTAVATMSIPILHTLPLQPGVHTIKIVITATGDDGTVLSFDGAYRWRRLVVLTF